MRFNLTTKLLLSLSALTLIVSVISITLSYQTTKHKLVKEFNHSAQLEVNMVTSVLTEAVHHYDFKQIALISNSLIKIPTIQAIEIVDHRDQLLTDPLIATEFFSDEPLSFQQVKIIRNKKEIGSYNIDFSTVKLNQILKEQIISTSFTIIALLAVLLLATYLLCKTLISHPIQRISELLGDIADGEGDLTKKLPIKSTDEISNLASNFNRFIEKIRVTIEQVINTTEAVKITAQLISKTHEKTAASMNEEFHKIELISAAIQELSYTTQEVSEHAKVTAKDTQDVTDASLDAANIVKQSKATIDALQVQITTTANTIDILRENSSNISTVMDVINNIAEQTNLLALNAAIEAARAGEQGRGFAVVADEVRSLAQKTQQSTEQTSKTIAALEKASTDANKEMETSLKSVSQVNQVSGLVQNALNKIDDSISGVNDKNQQIANASKEQSTVTEELSNNISSVFNLAESLNQDAEQMKQVAEKLAHSSVELSEELKKFKV